MLKHKKDIDNLKKEVVKRFAIGPSDTWRNRDFENLSFEINRETGVLLSNATLKRVFGKNKTTEDYFPQSATIQALCDYTNFTSSGNETKSVPKQRPSSKIVVFTSILIASLLAVFFLFPTEKIHKPIDTTLAIERIEDTFQTSLQFKYSVPEMSDSLFLHLAKGEKPVYLSPDKNTLRYFIRFPGYVKAYIANRDHSYRSKSENFLVKTEGWQSIAYYFEEDPVKRYYPIPPTHWLNDKQFGVNAKNLNQCGIDTTKVTSVRFENYKETHTSGDNFSLNAELQSCDYWPAISCYSIYTSVVCENGTIQIKTSDVGCSAYAEYTISEKKAYGSQVDLTKLCINIHEPFTLSILNENKQIQLLVNNEEVVATAYEKELGNIKGVSIEFHGSGSVNYVSLVDSEDNEVF